MLAQEHVLHHDLVFVLRKQRPGARPVLPIFFTDQPLDLRVAGADRRFRAIEVCCRHVEDLTGVNDHGG